MLAALASSPATKALDPDPFPRHSLRHAVYAALLHFGFETARISDETGSYGTARATKSVHAKQTGLLRTSASMLVSPALPGLAVVEAPRVGAKAPGVPP